MTKIKRLYRQADGHCPFEIWLERLRDVVGRAKVKVRVDRAILGNLGNHRSIGSGIIELKIDFGPGYRVYIGLRGEELLVLLCGGDKSTQQKDIDNAYEYWEDYKARL